MENEVVKSEKKYNIMRVIGYIYVAIALIAYILILLFALPKAGVNDDAFGQAVEDFNEVFFGILLVCIYSLAYICINVVPIVFSIILLVHDKKDGKKQFVACDLIMMLIPFIAAVSGFAIPLLLFQ